jgi:cytochrome c
MNVGGKKAGFVSASVAGAVVFGWVAATAQPVTPAGFTQDQANEGRKSYLMNCATCHKDDLSGGNAPALAGKTFETNWGKHTTADLYSYIRAMMPYCEGGALANQDYIDILAFILSVNGANAGDQDLTPNAPIKIGNIIGRMPAKPKKS